MVFAAAISSLFLLVGIIGLFTRPIRPVALPPPPDEPVPVLFEPPPPVAVPTQVVETEKTDSESPSDAVPQVVAVAPANAAVAFSVPTIGVVVPAKLAAAPPPRPLAGRTVQAAAPKVVEFKGVGSSSDFPRPEYPTEARRRRLQGRVMLYAEVDANGLTTRLEVEESSGFPILDNAAIQTVKNRWVWPSGEIRRFRIPFDFLLTK
jgi:periplasmic protein TonB